MMETIQLQKFPKTSSIMQKMSYSDARPAIVAIISSTSQHYRSIQKPQMMWKNYVMSGSTSTPQSGNVRSVSKPRRKLTSWFAGGPQTAGLTLKALRLTCFARTKWNTWSNGRINPLQMHLDAWCLGMGGCRWQH